MLAYMHTKFHMQYRCYTIWITASGSICQWDNHIYIYDALRRDERVECKIVCVALHICKNMTVKLHVVVIHNL